MRKEIETFFVIIVFLILPVSCSRKVLVPLEPEDEFERAVEFFNNKKFDTAAQSFERIIFYHAGSEFVDDAQFYLGRTYFEKKDYNQAIVEFDYLIKHFPNSPFVEAAYLYRAKATLFKAPGYDKDQNETKEAISLFDEFLTRFPNSRFTNEAKNYILFARNRLAKKELENGKLYVKLNEPSSAILYFKYVIDNYPETSSVAEAKYHLALIYEKNQNFDQALSLYGELLEDMNWRTKAEKRIKVIEKKKGR
uniref:Outer membrane protein assembly factor BamD n=1 Tax=candidate division WOR-3 bacterium TaxID=2052148 RepID=A0A7C4X9E1_UNCW3